ncbi:MAG: adenylyltransferase/cytidyltransferase family protein [Nanoarchaeota archaeon]|nr:adenylyltransferase/cytidyltransferase family protein [Nanoarchaeota archaeon]
MGKIISINKLKKINFGKLKTVLIGGSFDIITVGHIRYLRESKKFGDILIVGLADDKNVKERKGSTRPIFSAKQRAEIIAGLQSVDYVFTSYLSAYNDKILKSIKPDMVVISQNNKIEFKRRQKFKKLLESKFPSIKFRLLKISNKIHTTDIIKRILKRYSIKNIDVEKIILYKKLNKKIIREYSRFKFGDPIIIKKYANKLTKIIKNYIKKNKNYIIYTTAKAPINKYCKKNSLILTEQIFKNLKLPLIVGEYNYLYNRKKFTDNLLKRKMHEPIIKKCSISKFKKRNYPVLMIDDSIFTGAALKISIKQLKDITDKIIFFAIIDLYKQKYSEEEVNNFYYKEKGMPFLLKLFKIKKYIPTSHFIRVVDALEEKNKKILFENLNKKQKILLEKAYNIYTDKKLKIS